MSPATGTTTTTADTTAPVTEPAPAPGAAAGPNTPDPVGAPAPDEHPRRTAPVAARARAVGRRLPGLLGRGLTKVAAIVALLAVWEITPRVGLVDRTFLPPFSEVARAWWELLADGQLADNTEASLARSFTGFGLAVVIGVPLGLLIGRYRLVADLLGPLLEVFRNTAALALLPVFVLLLGIGETSKISIVLYACTWPILLNTISAVRQVDPTLLKLAKSMDLSSPRLFQKVILPASVPTIFTGIRLAGANAILVLVAAEMVGAKEGLGYLINSSQYNFAIPQMHAGILTISVIGVAFNQLLVTVERRLSSWRVPAHS
ncbi:putative ABC-type nitrate/sulfonate/bicarbonate transport system, permease component [Streptomyces himastatinicus ATCC 53653]|uniref:Putative ABC-type nitrate/sulfonate/bicarbonate transport system, permease component n=1 Tax=Streptomyces himastatinicus ATCC 53653 TaxID=457427 RepID=D9WKZ3_9ACTN|nr:ABC transporter permease [Streptomyces himastatinicus]EFL29268.1 putative ABC-type nitrate/sulfonate/bicarbonate transport system, permease component [Streptomyces himastatinicus ATCC 53653]